MNRASTAPGEPTSNRLLIIVVAAIIGLTIVAILLVTLVLGPGIDPTAGSSDAANPSTTVSASALPTTTATDPSATPTAAKPSIGSSEPSPTSEPSAFARPSDVLPVLAEVRATADGLRVRQDPGVGSEVIGTVSAGDILYVERGGDPNLAPRLVDGYEWYPVLHAPGYDGWPVAPEPEDRIQGYIAARSTSESFVELLPPECPGQLTDLANVVALTPYERVACLGARTLTLEGTFGCPFCDSLAYPWRTDPAWLATWEISLDMLVPSWSSYPPFPGSIELATPPDVPPIEPDPSGAILRVTGHFDDPRSSDCTITPEPIAGTTEPVHDEAAEWYCRERFVVESWEVIGTDPAFEALVPG